MNFKRIASIRKLDKINNAVLYFFKKATILHLFEEGALP